MIYKEVEIPKVVDFKVPIFVDNKNFRTGNTKDYFEQSMNENNDFKSYKSPRGKDPYVGLYEPGKVVWINVSGKTIEELVTNGEARELKYIGILENGSYFYPFLNDLYNNEEKYPYMEKIFDSGEMNYKEFKIKVFEINYQKFHDLNN